MKKFIFILSIFTMISAQNYSLSFSDGQRANIPVSEATSILKHSLTKPIIPLNLSESDISQAQKSTFRADNLNENITH